MTTENKTPVPFDVNETTKMEYIYRAKLKEDNPPRKKGDWVYGQLVYLKKGKKTVPAIYGCGEVIEETIGFYTNIEIAGVKCFDKDIICVQMRLFGEPAHRECYQVIYSKRFGLWTVAKADGKMCGASLASYARDSVTRIVGNMIDNPEMLDMKYDD